MARENVEVVRQRLRGSDRPNRTVDERIIVRLPALTAASARLVARLPPQSRLRQAVVSRAVHLAIEAYNRRDLDAASASWSTGFDYRPDRKWIEAGLVKPHYRGLAGYREYVATADEVWGGANYLTPLELVDLGDRMVLLAEGSMRAKASGVPLTEAYAVVLTLKNGAAIEIDEYFDHAEALKAVGLEN